MNFNLESLTYTADAYIRMQSTVTHKMNTQLALSILKVGAKRHLLLRSSSMRISVKLW